MAQGNGHSEINGLEADATKMMKELDGLVGKIKELGAAKPDEMRDAAMKSLSDQLKSLQDRLGAFREENKETLAKIDQSVKANPYLYILGALGIGVLLGKAMRS
jgi:ElaB/YqjD/DUF883 family membrane-anchored ribosome-binding protein